MGAASSPDRRRREDSSRERREYRDRSRDRSRERARNRSRERSRERGSSRGCDDRRRHDSSSHPHDRRDRPASTSGWERQQHHQHSGSAHDRPQHAAAASKGSSRPDRRDDDGDAAAAGGSRHARGEPPRPPPHADGRRAGGADAAAAADAEGGGRPRWGKPEEWAADEAAAAPPAAPKEGPNLGLSGKLAAETNKTADGSSELKFQPPREARVCKKPVWRLYTFKGKETLGEPLPLTQLPYYLFGKDRGVADFPTDHPSCSRQHAVIVFREVEVDAPDGIGYTRATKPYLIDLESINGTFINSEKVEPARYYELLTGDVVRFGLSSREYVLMNEAAVK